MENDHPNNDDPGVDGSGIDHVGAKRWKVQAAIWFELEAVQKVEAKEKVSICLWMDFGH